MYSLFPSLVIALACSTVALSADPTTVPNPPSGSTNVVVDVSSTSQDVTWTGAWEAESSSTCSSGTKVQRSSGTDSISVPFGAFSMSYNFTGSAVYVSLATNNALYGISLDGKTTFYGNPEFDPATPDNCTFGYSSTGLAEKSTHALVISVGALHSGRKRGLNARQGSDAPWSFEIESVVITQSGSGGSSSSPSSSGSSGSSNSTSGSTKPNAAQRQRGSSSWVMLPTFFVGASALAICLYPLRTKNLSRSFSSRLSCSFSSRAELTPKQNGTRQAVARISIHVTGGSVDLVRYHYPLGCAMSYSGTRAQGSTPSFDALHEKGQSNELNKAFTDLLHSPQAQCDVRFRRAQSIIPFLKLLPVPGTQTLRKTHDTMHSIGRQIISSSKDSLMASQEDKTDAKRDVLSVILKANMFSNESHRLSDAEVIAQMFTFLFAGHEMRVSGLTFFAVRETMRVHAPIAHTHRMAMQDDVLPLSKPYIDKQGKSHGSLPIPKGQVMHIPILAVNTDKEIWGDGAGEFMCAPGFDLDHIPELISIGSPERWEHIPDAASSIPGIGFRFSLLEYVPSTLPHAFGVNCPTLHVDPRIRAGNSHGRHYS
ncbi:cytochrome P450 [Mycena galericulata]|nr:cytochrome P450 [Mycena galericulata]